MVFFSASTPEKTFVVQNKEPQFSINNIHIAHFAFFFFL